MSIKIQVEGEYLEAKKNAIYQYEQALCLKILHEFEDESFTGKIIEERLVLNEMFDAIKTNARPDYVIVFNLKRFRRNAANIVALLQKLLDYVASLICVLDGVNSGTIGGKMMIIQIM